MYKCEKGELATNLQNIPFKEIMIIRFTRLFEILKCPNTFTYLSCFKSYHTKSMIMKKCPTLVVPYALNYKLGKPKNLSRDKTVLGACNL